MAVKVHHHFIRIGYSPCGESETNRNRETLATEMNPTSCPPSVPVSDPTFQDAPRLADPKDFVAVQPIVARSDTITRSAHGEMGTAAGGCAS